MTRRERLAQPPCSPCHELLGLWTQKDSLDEILGSARMARLGYARYIVLHLQNSHWERSIQLLQNERYGMSVGLPQGAR